MTIRVTNDLMFKKILSSEENKDILQGFIKDFCGLNVTCEEIHIETPYSVELYKQAMGDKENMLRLVERDIAVELRDHNIIVELQMYRDDHFIARTLHYIFERFAGNYGVPGKMTTDRAGKLNKYSSLTPVYAVNIVSGKLFPSDYDAARTFKLYDAEHDAGLDRDWIRLSFLELGKIQVKDLNQKYWHEFFTTGKAQEGAPAYIKKAENVTIIANMDEEERKMLSTYERNVAIRDSELSTALDYGYNQGMEQGVKKGVKQGMEQGVNALAKLIEQGVPLEEAVKKAKEAGGTAQSSESAN